MVESRKKSASTFRAMTMRERGRGAIIKMPGSDMSVRGTRDFTLVVDRSGRYERLQVVMQVYNGANNRREARGEIKETTEKERRQIDYLRSLIKKGTRSLRNEAGSRVHRDRSA